MPMEPLVMEDAGSRMARMSGGGGGGTPPGGPTLTRRSGLGPGATPSTDSPTSVSSSFEVAVRELGGSRNPSTGFASSFGEFPTVPSESDWSEPPQWFSLEAFTWFDRLWVKSSICTVFVGVALCHRFKFVFDHTSASEEPLVTALLQILGKMMPASLEFLADILLSVPIVFGLCLATRRDTGILAQVMPRGTLMRDAVNSRMRRFRDVCGILFLTLVSFIIFRHSVFGVKAPIVDTAYEVCQIVVVMILLCWVIAYKLSIVVVTSAIEEVKDEITLALPATWQAKVHSPAIQLATRAVPPLFAFTPQMISVFVAAAIHSLMQLGMVFKDIKAGSQLLDTDCIVLVFFMSCPLALACVPASLATAADELLNELNSVRETMDIEAHFRIQALETYLRQVNYGQGLGFMVCGSILKISTLSQLTLKVCAALLSFVLLARVMALDDSISTVTE